VGAGSLTESTRPRRAVVLHSAAGFSGARVWRLTTAAGAFCLRAAAPEETPRQMRQRHEWMARAVAAGLRFVPAVLPASSGSTVVEWGGCCWELMTWLPGKADFHDRPTAERLRAAAAALARLHNAWQPATRTIGPCPAVARRLDAVLSASAGGSTHPTLAPLLRRVDQALLGWRDRAAELLHPCRSIPCSIQPCLRDVWHDHLLFEGDVLTGLVDYAGAGVDAVAADLARMLGSLVGDDDQRWAMALDAYREVRPLSADEERLARILDRTGLIGGLSNWLRWLTEPGRTFSDPSRIAPRLEELLRRVESW
jgi:Ser/Thr protein kinase RdoA (MazF antagonist)